MVETWTHGVSGIIIIPGLSLFILLKLYVQCNQDMQPMFCGDPLPSSPAAHRRDFDG